jgi:hypothetical protein
MTRALPPSPKPDHTYNRQGSRSGNVSSNLRCTSSAHDLGLGQEDGKGQADGCTCASGKEPESGCNAGGRPLPEGSKIKGADSHAMVPNEQESNVAMSQDLQGHDLNPFLASVNLAAAGPCNLLSLATAVA